MMKRIIFLFLLVLSTQVFAVPVTENIDEDQTWSSGTYTIDPGTGSSISITDDAILTIEPGVVVEFAGDYDIIVEGGCRIDADSAIFTNHHDSTAVPGFWGSIIFEGSHHDTIATGDFDYCTFEYGGDYDTSTDELNGPISVKSFANVDIQYSTISDCFGTAIGVWWNTGSNDEKDLTARYNTIYRCESGFGVKNT